MGSVLRLVVACVEASVLTGMSLEARVRPRPLGIMPPVWERKINYTERNRGLFLANGGRPSSDWS